MRWRALLTLTCTLIPLCSAQDTPTSCATLEELNIFAGSVSIACCEYGCGGSPPLTCSTECAPVFVGYMDACAEMLAESQVDVEGRGFVNFYSLCSTMLPSLQVPEPAPEPSPEPTACVNSVPGSGGVDVACGGADGINTFCDIGGYTDLGPCDSWNGFACDDMATLEEFGFSGSDGTGASAALLAACPLACGTCSTMLPSLNLYAVGGYYYDDNGNTLTTAERYDPDLNSWTPIASMGTARDYFGLTALNNNLYAVGGYNGYLLTTAERYDPDTNSWTPIASMGTARYALGLTTLNNNLYAVGGSPDGGRTTLNTAEHYDPNTNSWTPIASMGTARRGLGLTTLNNNLYAVGGYDNGLAESNCLATAERYDPDTNSWTPIASMGTTRWCLGLTTLNNNLYAVGGSGGGGNSLNTAERYDPDTNSWTPIASMGTARGYLGLTTLNNNLYAVGGYDDNGNTLTTAERYDPDTNSWTPIASMGTARDYFGLTAL
eukprot:COSAG05_NODE_911_length_6636_cov_56.263577_5_plen_492_part_00